MYIAHSSHPNRLVDRCSGADRLEAAGRADIRGRLMRDRVDCQQRQDVVTHAGPDIATVLLGKGPHRPSTCGR